MIEQNTAGADTGARVGATVAVNARGRRTEVLVEVYEVREHGFTGWLLERDRRSGLVTRSRSAAGCDRVAVVTLDPRFRASVYLSPKRDLGIWGSAGTRLDLASRNVRVVAAEALA